MLSSYSYFRKGGATMCPLSGHGPASECSLEPDELVENI